MYVIGGNIKLSPVSGGYIEGEVLDTPVAKISQTVGAQVAEKAEQAEDVGKSEAATCPLGLRE